MSDGRNGLQHGFLPVISVFAETSSRAVYGMGLWPLTCRDWGGSNSAGAWTSCLFWLWCVVTLRSLWRADHSYRRGCLGQLGMSSHTKIHSFPVQHLSTNVPQLSSFTGYSYQKDERAKCGNVHIHTQKCSFVNRGTMYGKVAHSVSTAKASNVCSECWHMLHWHIMFRSLPESAKSQPGSSH